MILYMAVEKHSMHDYILFLPFSSFFASDRPISAALQHAGVEGSFQRNFKKEI
jgi:hypothetical protein